MQVTIHNPNKLPLIDYRVAKPLQGNLKDLSTKQHDKLLNVLKTRGFTQPLNLWHKGADFFIMDGHQRCRIMLGQDMNDNGSYEVPYLVTEAATKKEATAQLLEMTSQYGKVTPDGLDELAAINGLELEEMDIHFDAIDLDKFTSEIADTLDKELTESNEIIADKVRPRKYTLEELRTLAKGIYPAEADKILDFLDVVERAS